MLPAAPAPIEPAGAHAHALAHATVGFSVDTPQRAAIAARQGIDTTILYGGSPAPQSRLAKALVKNGIAVIDAGISSDLDYWECYRTLTVAPPPSGYTWCNKTETQITSTAALLHDVKKLLEHDAKRPYVIGYWMLDDWPFWDAGSARSVLAQIHALIAQVTPGEPAVCGFGAGVGKPHQVFWDPGTGKNYSNGGCDVVGWYVYSSFGLTHPSSGKYLDWSMKALLPAISKTLDKYGWRIAQTPLMGIGQAWSGSYNKHYYQPGLSREQMLEQAGAFCAFGATSISWYAWDDSGFESRTQTPVNSPVIASGIAAGIDACRKDWK